jgi:hypothetical protein
MDIRERYKRTPNKNGERGGATPQQYILGACHLPPTNPITSF